VSHAAYADDDLDCVECLSTDYSILASGAANGSIFLWDSVSGNCYRQLHGHSDKVTCIQFNEESLVSGSQDTTVRVLLAVVWRHINADACFVALTRVTLLLLASGINR
jgi:WD40 repeat protein